MNFNSLRFLLFLPVVLLLYRLLPKRARPYMLLVASYIFYMSWNALLVFLILGTTLVSYLAARFIGGTKSQAVKKLCLILTLVVCLGALVVFKYLDFLISNAIAFLNLFSLGLDDFSLGLLLPVGISFYTFQTLSYVIDVYRGKSLPEKNFAYYALFVSFFPQLVAGPIERADSLLPQLKTCPDPNSEDMEEGLRLLLLGFFRKCVVADLCGVYVNAVFSDLANATSLAVFLAGMLFILQIYGDFAGYSEIAAGCARMMGIRLMKNFDRPYSSVSFTEFFRRWHISLNRWFTDYLYIPLGGNRKGTARKLLNVAIVFLLCGLWHGAGWTYVLWGAYSAFFVCLETVLVRPLEKKLAQKLAAHGTGLSHPLIVAFRRGYMFLLLTLAGLIFRSGSTEQLVAVFTALFTRIGWGAEAFSAAFSLLGLDALSVLTLGLALFAMCLLQSAEPPSPVPSLAPSAALTRRAQKVFTIFYTVFAVAVFWIFLLSLGDSSAFLYFKF